MAKSAAKLSEENLEYSNGQPVKVVIADTTIGRVGEAAACAAYRTLSTPNRIYYIFNGWYTDAICSGEAVSVTTTVSAAPIVLPIPSKI